mgnify:CR=1 FL=1
MVFIPEQWIDEAAERLDSSPEAYEAAVDQLRAEQPVLLSYCFTESFEAFTDKERQYMLYLLLVIWQSVKRAGGSLPEVSEQQLGETEERNWSTMQSSKGGSFRNRLDPFFEGYEQEDLLAFLEDALTPEEEGEPFVSREGQEALFVSLKTAVDCLTGAGETGKN